LEGFSYAVRTILLKPDYEYAVVDNTVHVGRIHPFSAQANFDVLSQGELIALRTSNPGRLDNLHWASYQAPVLKGDELKSTCKSLA
jgi:hypothetical protein